MARKNHRSQSPSPNRSEDLSRFDPGPRKFFDLIIISSFKLIILVSLQNLFLIIFKFSSSKTKNTT